MLISSQELTDAFFANVGKTTAKPAAGVINGATAADKPAATDANSAPVKAVPAKRKAKGAEFESDDEEDAPPPPKPASKAKAKAPAKPRAPAKPKSTAAKPAAKGATKGKKKVLAERDDNAEDESDIDVVMADPDEVNEADGIDPSSSKKNKSASETYQKVCRNFGRSPHC